MSSQKFPIKCHSFHSSSSPDAYSQLIKKYSNAKALQSGKALHACLIVNGLSRRTYFASKLIAFYTCTKHLSTARKLFDRIPESNNRRWMALIGSYARNGFYQETVDVFFEMQRDCVRPSRFVFPSVLKACGHLSKQRIGEVLHGLVLKNEFEVDVFVISSLVDMYSKCGKIDCAQKVFDGMVDKDVVVLNAMVSGYVHCGNVKKALELVQRVKKLDLHPDLVTWNTLIAGFSQENDESMVWKIFKLMQENGIDPDVVSWTSVISGFVQNFRNKDAFQIFKHMLSYGFCPNTLTISSLLPACATVADIRCGRQIHGYAVVMGYEKDVFVRSALVDMYSKCGHIYLAETLFFSMRERTVATWNSMIFGYANHGFCGEAVGLFNRMVEKEGIKLNHLTFTATLTACCHSGMVQLGRKLFQMMIEKYGINPRLEHYACMVSLLGKAGELAEAYDFILNMPIEPDFFVWGALLGACREHGNVCMAEIVAERLAKLEPGCPGSNLLMSSLYIESRTWDKVDSLKTKSCKFPSRSWMQLI